MSRISTHSTRRQQSPRKLLVWAGFSFSILMIMMTIFFLFLHFKTNEQVPFTNLQNPIIHNGAIFENGQALLEKEEIYLPLSFIKEHIEPDAIFDEKTQSVIFAVDDQVVQFQNEALQYFVNEQPYPIHMPVMLNRDEHIYVAAEPLFSIYRYQMNYYPETGAVLLYQHGDPILAGTVSADRASIKVQQKPSLFSPYISEVSKGETVIIEADEPSYYYIRKNNGIGGYVKKENILLKNPEVIEVTPKIVSEKPALPKLQWPINLTWEAVYTKNPNTASIPAMPGLNVISPTWFHLKNGEGEVDNLASLEYVKWAKRNGYQVWALFSNDFDPDKTHEALKDFSTRQKIIRQLLLYANMYQIDGLNIDFENVNVDDQALVTQFVKELTAYMHQAGLVVSMDITFISSSENWSMFYDREKLADIVDYLIVMAYDEHWGSSPIAGSVASLPWVENNLKKLLEVIPNERLILGVPTYTRIWKEQTTPGGNIEVSSKAYKMDSITNWIDDHGATVLYDEKSGQDYAEYVDENENARYRVWIENEKSLKKRSQLVHQYQLAGIASWNRSFSNIEAWTTIDQSLRQLEPVKK